MLMLPSLVYLDVVIILLMMILYCCFVLFGGAMICYGSSQKKVHVDPTCPHCPNFDVTGVDFSNTQTRKLCMLARLNASIVFTHG